MNRCLVCNQPLLPNSRTDKLTWSHSCRTRRYRQRKDQTNPTGSLPWRRQLHLTQPIYFFEVTPDSHPSHVALKPDTVLHPGYVPTCYWDSTLEAMNLLRKAHEELDFVLGWPDNKWGAHADPVTGDTVIDEQNVVGALQGHLDNLYGVFEKLAQLRGRVEHWLRSQQDEFGQGLMVLRKEIRRFAQGVEHIPLNARYEIIYRPELVAVATSLYEHVGQWWFTLNDEVD